MKIILILIFLLNVGSVTAQTNEDLKNQIRRESVENGNLDFTKIAEEQAKGSALIMYHNIVYNKKDFSILLWSAKVKSLGFDSLKEVKSLWEEINNRKLTEPEMKALKKGFEIEF